jgi:hypothetical protein
LIYYDWLADSAATSHITHQRDVFTSYTPVDSRCVTAVGSTAVKIAGHRTVELILMCNSEEHILHLQHVLHVPGTRNNLISLGQWDVAGRCYQGRQGQIMLITKNGKPVVQGEKVNNHLYKMKMKMKNPLINNVGHIAFIRNTNVLNALSTLSWETWH